MSTRGRKQREPMERLVRLLAVLSAAGERGVSAEKLIAVAGFDPGNADPGTQLTKEFRLLRKQGWQIDNVAATGIEGTYRLVKGDNRFRLSLSQHELAALQRAALVANRDDLVSKLGLSSADRPADVVLGDYDTELDQVMSAVRDRAVIRFRYKGSQRVVHPGSLINQNGWWYLHGVEDDAVDSKAFVVSRMSEVHVDVAASADPVPAVRRLNLHPMRWEVDDPIEVVVRAPAKFVPDVIRWLQEPHRRVDHGDQVDLYYHVTNRAALRSRIYLLGTRAHVVSPAAIRDEIVAELEAMV